ncbi:MAG: hypothetical protein ABSG43_26090 [Solirubrobacteraceae bacterium]
MVSSSSSDERVAERSEIAVPCWRGDRECASGDGVQAPSQLDPWSYIWGAHPELGFYAECSGSWSSEFCGCPICRSVAVRHADELPYDDC